MSYDRLNWYIFFIIFFQILYKKIKGNVILTGIIRRTYLNYRQRIRDLREDADKTQTQIADYLGTSQTMYARYERGANEMPIRYLVALCKYYQVSADYILGFTNVKISLPSDPHAKNNKSVAIFYF